MMEALPEHIIDISVNQMPSGGVTVFCIKGTLDALTSRTLEKAIFKILSAENNRILLNLKELDYISSSGLRSLLTASRKVHSFGGKLLLCCLSKNIKLTILNSGFGNFFLCESSEDIGLKTLTQK